MNSYARENLFTVYSSQPVVHRVSIMVIWRRSHKKLPIISPLLVSNACTHKPYAAIASSLKTIVIFHSFSFFYLSQSVIVNVCLWVWLKLKDDDCNYRHKSYYIVLTALWCVHTLVPSNACTRSVHTSQIWFIS